ncbi:hypothetical protein [Bifidobacterium crudilactis]|uniref:hypothetical protein n=1 Tax=Bifidobacterium crudilactis TaxID=327277 RepID=UPI002354170D|nr:hypothetical protein [Bifidobacterium crudilactis]MCI1217960.1 hypothetical protein [Bifidobacterium crudilactis]
MKRFFHDISWVQILAGALAAVTAFLLSSRIGIAGSVIGVAVGSIVSAFASQLYQNVLDESSKKLHDTVGSSDDGEQEASESSDSRTTANSGSDAEASHAEETRTIVGLAGAIADAEAADVGTPGDSQTHVMPPVTDSTKVIDPAVTRMATSDSTSVLEQGNGGTSLDTGASTGQAAAAGDKPRIASNVTGAKVSQVQGAHVDGGKAGKASAVKHGGSKKIKRNVIIVSIVSALLAVGITAGIIYAVTGGQGTDRVLTPSETPSSVQTTPSGESTPTTDSDGTGSNSGGSESSGSSTPSSSSSSSSSPTSSSDSSSSSTSTPTSTPSPSTSTATPTQSPTSSAPTSSSSTSGGNNNAAASEKSSSSPSTGSAQAEE